ncbi:MAG: hypothetical protein FWF88_09595 [Peptococcaceae bacterium]|nr:hypothetical protein [Peptococcaceae bacterium]
MSVLIVTAAGIALFHTLIGVDHYIPFVALSKANNWVLRKTIFVVLVCGVGHVFSSVLLGLGGIALGSAVTTLVNIESWRGELAVWFLVAFGLVYMLWGIRAAYKNKPHTHLALNGSVVEHVHSEVDHIHEHDGHAHYHRTHEAHVHEHEHEHEPARENTHNHGYTDDHSHSHETIQDYDNGKKRNTFWMLVILFVLGPCEPLIPLLMYPAAESNLLLLTGVTAVFAVVTIGTMLGMTLVALKGLQLLPMKKLDRYSHVLAGLSVLLCGLAIMVFGI